MSIEAEYREPDPELTELSELRAQTRDRLSENYFRYGYRVGDAKPMMINRYGKSLPQAQKLAKAKAEHIRDQLREIGAPTDVSWWVQPWHVQSADVYETAEVTPL